MAESAASTSTALLEERLQEYLARRQPPKTLCPSEVARSLSTAELAQLDLATWREAMPAVRQLAWRLRDEGSCEVLQKGEVVGAEVRLEDVRGPIRLRRSGG